MSSPPFQGGTINFLKLSQVYSSLLCAGFLRNSYLPNASNKYLANNLVYSLAFFTVTSNVYPLYCQVR